MTSEKIEEFKKFVNFAKDGKVLGSTKDYKSIKEYLRIKELIYILWVHASNILIYSMLEIATI